MQMKAKASGDVGAARGGGTTRRLGWPSAGTVIGCLALTLAVGGTGYAASGSGSSSGAVAQSSATVSIVGSWVVTVNRGPSLPPVKSLQTFAKGGGMVTTQNVPPTFGGPAHGAWEKTGTHEYGTTFMFFRYDPSTGAHIGSTKLRCTLELARDGQSMTSVCSPEFRNAAGALEPGSNVRRDTGTGERVNVEPIPVSP